MNKKIILLALLVLSLSSCKTFILAKHDLDWNYDDFDEMAEKMCITNKAKGAKSEPCDFERDTVKVTKVGSNTYVFPISKRFIEYEFKKDKLQDEVNAKFKVKDQGKSNYTDEETVLALGLNFFFDDIIDKNLAKRLVEKKIQAKKDKKAHIKNSIKSLFWVAYERLNDDPNDSGIGIGIRPVRYSIDGSDYGLVELFFVDMDNRNQKIGSTIYGYISFFKAGRGGINISIPTCFISTTKWMDGCVLDSKSKVGNFVRKSQIKSDGWGKPVFQFSMAKYVPPPKEPEAKGVPLNI